MSTRPEHPPIENAKPLLDINTLPSTVSKALWRATELGAPIHTTVPSGFEALDRELPGGGWPRQALIEVLSPQSSVLEWRLMGPALRAALQGHGPLVLVGPPKHPHLPGLMHSGIDEKHLVWVQADAPGERLWCTEQIIQSQACGVLVAWLPQARPEHLRRLQISMQSCQGLVFICRPTAAQHEASAAPLRVMASTGADWDLHVQVLKRRGPVHTQVLHLNAIPGGLAPLLTPRLRQPSRLHVGRPSPVPDPLTSREVPVRAVGSPASSARPRRHATAS